VLGLPVHLYGLNEVSNARFTRVPRELFDAWYQQLTAAGLRVRMSSQARLEDNGGCGRLVATHRAEGRLPVLR
jgi:23S rRNA (adenine2503-C2)-methyltransferase